MRANILSLKKIAKKMGLVTTTNVNLWKDQALLEANVAVLYSFQVSLTVFW